MRNQDAVRAYRIEVVPCDFHSRVAVRPVVVVPVLLCHQCRNPQTHSAQAHTYPFHRLFPFGQCVIQRRRSYSYPHAEEIERPCVCVVTLAYLIWRLVQIEDYGQSCHKEHQEVQETPSLVLFELETKAYQSENQRQEEVVVLTLVMGQYLRRVALVSETGIVYELDSALPVSVENVARNRGVNVVLPSHEIPHKVSPIHPVALVVEEIPKVRAHRRLAFLTVSVVFVEFGVTSIRRIAPHTREEHLVLSQVVRVDRSVHLFIFAVYRSPVLRGLEVVVCAIVLAIDKGSLAVLLTGKVSHQGKGIVRLVLVSRSLSARTDDVYGENRESYGNHGEAQKRRVQQQFALLHSLNYSPEAKREQRHHKERRTAVIRQMQYVHEE